MLMALRLPGIMSIMALITLSTEPISFSFAAAYTKQHTLSSEITFDFLKIPMFRLRVKYVVCAL